MNTAMPDTDVLVVGAGPTGLLLAGDLAAAGRSVTVLERRPPGVSNLTRAFGVHARTLELMDTRGLADALVATGTRLDELRLFDRLSLDLSTLPSRFPYLLVTPQYEVERLLERRAVEAGVRFRHHTELTGLTQDATGVTARVQDGAGTASTLRATYAVGTDGHRSTVREALGLPFPGKSVLRSILLADVRLTDPPPDVLSANGVGDAFAFLAPFGDGWYRVFAWRREPESTAGGTPPDRARAEHADDEPVTLDEVRAITRHALGSDYGMSEARWLSRFHSDERQVPDYRVGRVLLAGDAAHVHSPAGGQGMNTGLQDAANLSWKLAEVLAGRAGDALLDSYHEERHRVGRTVLRSSGMLVRLAMADTPAQRARRALLALAVKHVGPVRRRAVGSLSGVGIRYPAPRDRHPAVGSRVPDLPLTGGGRLYETLRAGRFVLLTPPHADPSEPPQSAGPAGAAGPAGSAGPAPGTPLVIQAEFVEGFGALAEIGPG
ncbi:FAD-dependent oxidoreductase, partial [Streptomyces sparsus]